MLKKPVFAVAVTSIAVILYNILPQFSINSNIAAIIFVASPFLMVWMAYTILKHGKYNGKELADKEEWGYQDKNRDQLGMF
jgi:lipopolysaccharide export LptBFGC system permease protein LptF